MEKDKILHIAAGAAVSLIGCALYGPPLGIALAVAAGVGKEWYDSKGHGTVDNMDALATIGGGAVMAGLWGFLA